MWEWEWEVDGFESPQAPLSSRVYGLARSAEGGLSPAGVVLASQHVATRGASCHVLDSGGAGTRTVQIRFKRVGRNRP